ncbi:hypothetical protein [Agromyces sp. Leaf222]|uniref:hypothetical protein n=1 Tax=Agromyces sp. Leaf222 TaxID=1735688 RepID=UPI0012F94B99|nr:hypothetical protein [Agromyces sp. Leaf222]
MGSTRRAGAGSVPMRRRVLVSLAVASAVVLLIIGGRVISEGAAESTGLAVFDVPPRDRVVPGSRYISTQAVYGKFIGVHLGEDYCFFYWPVRGEQPHVQVIWAGPLQFAA